MKPRVLTATVALFSAFGAGCGSAPRPDARTAPHLMVASEALSARVATSSADERAARVLRRELAADEALAGERIGVEVVDGVATLAGHVTNRRAAESAIQIAPVVRGVRAVLDHIEVVRVPQSDDALEMHIASALGRDPAIAYQHIAAKVQSGVARLTGDIDNAAARRVAIDDVLAIRGVIDVTDLMAVVPQQQRDDATIVNETHRVLRDDPWIDGSHVRVTADHGVLTLAGWVPNEAELARVESDARRVCPPRLDVTALEIDTSPSDDGTLRGEPLPVRHDADLAQAVIAAYSRDERLSAFLPGTDVHNGVVILTGIAPSRNALLVAIEDARNVPGVTDVRSAVQLRSSIVQGDDVVRNDVYGAIRRDPQLSGQKIAVGVLHGRVLLRGAVRTSEERMAAIADAASIPGVSDVVDVIDVQPRAERRRSDESLGRAEAQAPNEGATLPASDLPAYSPAPTPALFRATH